MSNTEEPKKLKRVVDDERRRGWLVAPRFTEKQLKIIQNTIAKGLNEDELAVFIYRARAYNLDPLKGEISVRVHNAHDPAKRQMVVIVQRDGYLTIAHKSGMFNGMQSGVKKNEEGQVVGWAKVWNKSAEYPVEIEVDFDEYNPNDATRYPLWAKKPKTMIQKVAESQALRRAFNISGVYEESEADSWDGVKKDLPQLEDGNKPATEAQLATIGSLSSKNYDTKSMTKQQAAELIKELLEQK